MSPALRTAVSRSGLVVGALALLALAAAPASADKCTGAKLKAIGKKESGLLSCHAKVASTGNASGLALCVAKVEAKYVAAFTKAGSCSGTQAVCECLAENCATAVRANLPDAGPSKCESARLKAAGKKASGKLGCNSKAAAKSVPVDAACIAKVEAKYQAAFAKVTGCAGDATTVETTVNQKCVSAVGADPTGGATVGAICASCNLVTTTTILGATTTTTITPARLPACPVVGEDCDTGCFGCGCSAHVPDRAGVCSKLLLFCEGPAGCSSDSDCPPSTGCITFLGSITLCCSACSQSSITPLIPCSNADCGGSCECSDHIDASPPPRACVSQYDPASTCSSDSDCAKCDFCARFFNPPANHCASRDAAAGRCAP